CWPGRRDDPRLATPARAGALVDRRSTSPLGAPRRAQSSRLRRHAACVPPGDAGVGGGGGLIWDIGAHGPWPARTTVLREVGPWEPAMPNESRPAGSALTSSIPDTTRAS